jgi:hypothetical protein
MKNFKLVILFLFIGIRVDAQYSKDAGAWFSTKVSFDGKDGRTFYVAPELRLDENGTRMVGAFSDIGVQQKIAKGIQLQAEWRAGIRQDWEYLSYRQRWGLGLSGELKVGDWELGMMLRQQWGQSNFDFSDKVDLDTRTVSRARVSLKYEVTKKLNIYTSHELFFNSTNLQYTSWRWQGGLSKELSKNQNLKLGYLIQQDQQSGDQDFVVTAGWVYQFKRWKEKELLLTKGKDGVLDQRQFQDEIQLMNGREMRGEVFLDSTLLVKIRYRGVYGKWKEIEMHRSEIFSVTKAGKEMIFYAPDTTLGDRYSQEEMRIFLLGEKDAFQRYQARHTAIIGFLTCGTISYLGGDGIMSLIGPPILYTLAHIPGKIRVRKHHISNDALKYNDLYAEGFEPVARGRRLNKAMIWSSLGSVTGLFCFLMTK